MIGNVIDWIFRGLFVLGGIGLLVYFGIIVVSAVLNNYDYSGYDGFNIEDDADFDDFI